MLLHPGVMTDATCQQDAIMGAFKMSAANPAAFRRTPSIPSSH
jgi:hypothetical protein